MQARIVASAFTTNPLEARAMVEFVPESQAEHEQLASLFGDRMGVIAINRSAGTVLRSEFRLFNSPVPSAADLDADAMDKAAKENTEESTAT